LTFPGIFSIFYPFSYLGATTSFTFGIWSKIPGNKTIAIFALIFGVVTFIVRIWIPSYWNFEPLNLGIPFFPQYITMFIVGLIAYRGNWFLQIIQRNGYNKRITSKIWVDFRIYSLFKRLKSMSCQMMGHTLTPLFSTSWNYDIEITIACIVISCVGGACYPDPIIRTRSLSCWNSPTLHLIIRCAC